MKRTLIFLMVLVLMLGACPALAKTIGNFKYEPRSDGSAKITGYIGTDAVLEIPAELDGRKVTEIDRAAFEGNTCLTGVTIPETVISLGTNSFRSCPSLQEVNAAESSRDFASIDGVLFSKDGHMLISYPPAHEGDSYCVPDGTRSIGAAAFYGCARLKSVTLPDTLKIIGSSAFYGCRSLKSVSFPEGFTTLGASAFRNCAGLTSLTLPDTVTTLGAHAFDGCTALTSANIPAGVTTIGEKAFYGCPSLTMTVVSGSRAARYAKANGIAFIWEK